ncbi:esterase/lipase family protein [Nocardia mangyaensis]|nr:lipase [Nocardia mangyaensis]
MGRTVRLVVAAQFAAFSVLALGAVTAQAEPPAPRKIAFIVPGQQLYAGGPVWASLFEPMRSALEQRGFETHYIDAPGRLLREDAELIRARVTSIAEEADEVALVGHSVGGVSARWFLAELGGHPLVDSSIAIGTAQYGSPGGCTQGPADGYDACVYSDLFPQLNAGDDTPGKTRYTVLQSSGEWADGRLDGGQCRVYVDGILGSGTGFDHIVEVADPTLLAELGAAADGECTGTYVDEADGTITWQDTMTETAPPVPYN